MPHPSRARMRVSPVRKMRAHHRGWWTQCVPIPNGGGKDLALLALSELALRSVDYPQEVQRQGRSKDECLCHVVVLMVAKV